MPATIGWANHGQSRRRRKLFFLLIVAGGVLFGGRAALSSWVDLLWFRSLGYGDVFWKTWTLQYGICAIFAAATFLILYGAFWALKRAHQADLPSDHSIVFGGQPVNLSVEPVLRLIAIGVSLTVAVVTGTTMMDDWPTLALFRYAPPSPVGSVVDPIFGKPLNFFLFTLPAWHLIVELAVHAVRHKLCPWPACSFSLRAERVP